MKKLFYLLVMIGGALLLASCEREPDDERVPLNVPENIGFSVTENSATFTWDEVSGAVGYSTEIKNDEDSVTTQEASDATVTFSGLTAGAEYSFRVKANSSDGLSDSEFTEWTGFKVSASLAVPANVEVSDITDSSANVSWDAVAGATGYKVEHRKAAGAAAETLSSSTSVFITGLDAETSYEVRVMAVGDQNFDDSEFSGWVGFTSGEGALATGFSGGDGTEANPYLIATPGQLALLANKVNNEEEGYVTAHYKLVADIDLTGREWIPIGVGTGSDVMGVGGYRHDFIGFFDGDGHTVGNLYCVMTDDADPCIAGLFGINRGNIRNVNVTGYSESNTTFSGSMGYSIAGGVVGANALSDDKKTGIIENCKFSGSVKAASSTDVHVIPSAGGICGVVASGNINANEVVVGVGDKIEAIGATADAGGITGWFSAGGIRDCKVTVDGAIRAVIKDGASAVSLTANAGGLISGCGENMGYFSNCEVNIPSTGSLYSESFSDSGTANAGGIAATSRASFGGMKVNIAGKIEALCRDAGRVSYVGGVLGQGTDIMMSNCEATISGTLSSISDGSSGAAYIGGMMGNGTGTFSWNAVTLDGSYYVEANNSVFCGGLYGGSGTTGGCHLVMGSAAKIEMKSGIQYFGGITGNARLSNHHGCYAIIGGSVKANTSGNILMGGICASIGGTSTSQRRNITGSYTIIDGTFTVEGGQASPSIGGIVGSTTAYGTMSGDWWWCGNSSVTQGHGVNASASGISQFAGKDKASLEAALDSINAALEGVSFAGRFVYDEAKQRLVITQE